jgi:hypothetical protein
LTQAAPPGRRLSPLEEREKRRRRKLILIGSMAFVGVVAVVGGIYIIMTRRGADPVPQTRAPLQVSAKKGHYHTIAEAVKAAKDRDVIELADELHAESLELTKPRAITIQAKPGVKVVWVPTKPGEPLLRLQNAKNVHLNGKNLTLDGHVQGKKGVRVENLINIEYTCPGLILEDVQLQGFSKYGVAITNCAGSKEQPVRLVNLHIVGDRAEAAIYFNAFPNNRPEKNSFIHVESSCKFSGFDAGPAVSRRDNQVIDEDVIVPGGWK